MTASANFTLLDSQEALARAAEHSEREPVLLYKHSVMCGLSDRARRQLMALTEATDPPIYEVVVQGYRALSNAIEQQLGIRHETPQVILLYRGRAVFDTSHWHIRVKTIRKAIDNLISSV